MEACLYHPQHGYYAKADQQPRRDYLTNVDVSPLFGRLLTRQLCDMWKQLEFPDPFWVVEAGAGTGDLAKHILSFAAGSQGEFYSALRYAAVERSEARRNMQARILEGCGASGHFVSLAEMPAEIPCGCVLSNELFDAMPVHRVIREGRQLREMYVSCGENGFYEKADVLSSSCLAGYFEGQGIVLRQSQQAEACLDACKWIEETGRRLGRGFVLTIDYGHEARELYDGRHMRGTLLAYEHHRASESFYCAPGEQDLTAHVNFTALDLHGQRSSLSRTGLTTQTNFLLALARHSDHADLQCDEMNPSEQSRARLLFKTLINPEGVGETFRVFIQHKGIESPRLAGLELL
jgi:SAM-dependent MidA family methyltransferase